MTGLEVENFRPFTTRVQLDQLTTLNVITGPNNVGKSSLLMPLRRLTRMDDRYVPKRPVSDGHGSFGSVHSAIFFPTDIRGDGAIARISITLRVPELPSIFGKWFLQQKTVLPPIPEEGPVELELELTGRGYFQISFSTACRSALATFHKRFPGLTMRKFNDGDVDGFARDVARAFAARILYVPAFRVAGKSYVPPDTSMHQERLFDGSSLLADLLSWWLPDPETGNPRSVNRIERLCSEVSTLLDRPVRIWPTPDQQIHVSIGRDPARRLDDLGHGICQLVNIVAAVVSVDETPLVILEEPEICLHAGLQRKLVDYLAGANSQTFVTTHSNHLIDAASDRGRMFLVRHDVDTNSRAVISVGSDLLRAIGDLGVTASSIAAASALVWVEGPSDAIYLQHWITRMRPELRFGRDFIFAFHGGALLDHAGVDEKLVRILRVHPGFYLVADSDRKTEDGELGHQYLGRFLQERDLALRSWITKPKEIEGYIPDAAFADPVPANASTNGYMKLKQRLTTLGLPKSAHKQKVELAREAVTRLEGMTVENVFGLYDLREKVTVLVEFIEKCRVNLPPVVPIVPRIASPLAVGDGEVDADQTDAPSE